MLAANWTSGSEAIEPIKLAITQTLDPTISYSAYNYVASGCYRGTDWPWWLQGLKWQWTLPLIPTFALLLALWNLQAVRKWNDVKHIVIMVIFGCASYAGESESQHREGAISERQLISGNLVGQTYIHGSVGGVLGAFSVSLLGSIYARIWNGYAFAAMVPGVLLLVPVEHYPFLHHVPDLIILFL